MTAIAGKKCRFVLLLVTVALAWGSLESALAQTDWKKDWEKKSSRSKERGQVVVGIPARPELRKQLEAVFKPKFGIEIDLLTARGPQNASRIAAEYAAGVKYFDVFIGGSGTFESLVESGAVEPFDADAFA